MLAASGAMGRTSILLLPERVIAMGKRSPSAAATCPPKLLVNSASEDFLERLARTRR